MKKRRKKLLFSSMMILPASITAILFPLVSKAFSQDAITKLKVVAEQANIRLMPDISSIIIRQFPKGTILDSTGKEGEWFMVLLPSNQEASTSGYVHESLVEVLEPPSQRKKAPEKTEGTIPRPRSETTVTAGPSLPFGFSLVLMGGGGIIAGGDLNPGIQGLAGLYEDILGITGEGKIDPVHLGYSLGIELDYPFSSHLSWGIGCEILRAKNESTVGFQQGSVSYTLLTHPHLSAVPISLFLSAAPLANLYVKGGISYYFARCSYFYQIQEDDWSQKWEGKANARGLGLVGGFGIMKKIAPSLSFVAEGMGRLIKIDGFKGKGTFQDEAGQIVTEEGKLYFIQNQVLEQRTHNTLFIRRTRPNEAGVIEAREAQINFSGISLRIGLRFDF